MTGRLAKALHGIIEADPRVPSVVDVAECLQVQAQEETEVLLSLLSQAFAKPSCIKKDDERIASVKIALALLPRTAPDVERALGRFRSKADYELHFTLFCFLDEVPRLSGGSGFANRIPSLVEQYLLQVPTGTASAAWMAGDLLGDHWELRQGCRALCRIVRDAHYAAGREGAVQGLRMAAGRSRSRRRDDIIAILSQVANHDRSRGVRVAAGVALRLVENKLERTRGVTQKRGHL